MAPKITVVGSSNTDMILKLPRIPRPGETVTGGTFTTAAGGKGANQAVAAARAGGRVAFVAKVGADNFGQQARQSLQTDGVDVSFVYTDDRASSGVAFIFVDENGENSIGVAAGANKLLSPQDVRNAGAAIASAEMVLMQLETPLESVREALAIATENNVRTILNPAPARALDEQIFHYVTILTPNEWEAETLTGIKVDTDASAIQAAQALRDKGVSIVLLTRGARGVLIAAEDSTEFIPAFKVKAVDSTAAGDVFNGTLAVALAEGLPLPSAVRFACAAAAISVTRLGAQPSAPYRPEIEAFLQEHDLLSNK